MEKQNRRKKQTKSLNNNNTSLIKENILSGLFKLVTKHGRSKIWDTFKKIQNDEGVELENKVCCKHCYSIMVYYSNAATSNLIRHKCHKVVQNKNKTQEKLFDIEENLTIKDLQNIGQDDVSCDDALSNLDKQKSTGNKRKKSIIQNATNAVSNRALEINNIKENILNGSFKLNMVWDSFARIRDNDGVEVKGKVCCKKCFSVMKYDERCTSNLTRHKCYTTANDDEIISNDPLQSIKFEDELDKDYSKIDNTDAGSEISQDEDEVDIQMVSSNKEISYSDLSSNETNGFDMDDSDFNNKTPSLLLDNANIKEKILTGTYTLEMNHGRSKVWSIFERIRNNEGIELENKVCCKKCFAVLKYDHRCASNLIRHKCYMAIKEIEEENKIEVNNDTKEEATRLLSSWCIQNCRPIQFVQDSGLEMFGEFLVTVVAKYGTNVDIKKLIPKPTKISKSIGSMYNSLLNKIKKEIASDCQHGFGLTSFIWTDTNMTTSFISLTIHYTKNGKLCSRFLGLNSIDVECSKNGIIRSITEKSLAEYGCCLKDGIIITRKSSDMLEAFNHCHHLYCINELLNCVVQKSMKQVIEVETLINLCSKLLKYFKKYKTNVPAQWNSEYFLLETIDSNWLEITNILQSSNDLEIIEKIERNHIKGIINTLRPFEQASKILEGEKYATLHLVYAYVTGLKNKCMPKDDDIKIIKTFKEAICENIQVIILSKVSKTHKLAHFLFPPANKLLHFNNEEKELLKSECAIQLKEFYHAEAEEKEINKETPTTSNNTMMSSFFSSHVMTEPNLNSEDKIKSEILAYESLNVPFEENFDTIMWWNVNQTQFPLLYKLSCKILATPASSAPSEKVFLIARQLLSERISDSSLNSDILNKMVFLKMNFDELINTDVE